MKKILIIEDDKSISDGIKLNLETENYKVLTEYDGEDGFNSAEKKTPDLILLDINLPGMNGFDVCRNLRMKKNNTPIIMLSVKSDEADKILGLELGADDYVTKPFSMKELLARIKAILRRRQTLTENIETLTFGNVSIDFVKMKAMKNKKEVHLSLKEYEILKFLAANEDRVISRSELLDKVWGYDVFPTTRTVDNFILMLRKKLEENPAIPKHIFTIHSAGYKFVKYK